MRRLAVNVTGQDAEHVRALFAAALPEWEVVDAAAFDGAADFVVAGARDERRVLSLRPPRYTLCPAAASVRSWAVPRLGFRAAKKVARLRMSGSDRLDTIPLMAAFLRRPAL